MTTDYEHNCRQSLKVELESMQRDIDKLLRRVRNDGRVHISAALALATKANEVIGLAGQMRAIVVLEDYDGHYDV